ncbi:pro-MCH [Amia ocellicauda]|uniref:pro-MCH n=1 Tax=Amia ocellicauda TaxID=2972642 RepID=UPI003463C94A
MSLSAYSVVLAVAVFFESYTDSVAMSISKIEDSRMMQDAFTQSEPFLNEELVDKSINTLPSSNYPVLEGTMANEGGNSKIIILTDLGLKKNFRDLQDFQRFRRPALSMNLPARHLPIYTVREEAPQGETVQRFEKDERRDTGSDANIPVGRRDYDMLRCMLGRVYRPCWQV